MAEHLRLTIAEHDFLAARGPEKPLRITASLGIAARSDSVEDIDTLIHRADSFLYRAKRLGKNRIECLARAPRISTLHSKALEVTQPTSHFGPFILWTITKVLCERGFQAA